jgi:hypothetical protein
VGKYVSIGVYAPPSYWWGFYFLGGKQMSNEDYGNDQAWLVEEIEEQLDELASYGYVFTEAEQAAVIRYLCVLDECGMMEEYEENQQDMID